MMSLSNPSQPQADSTLVMVCQNTACRKAGAKQVLQAFQAHAGSDIRVEGRPCLGQCGNGPMVIVLPEQVWYCRVQPDEVPAVVKRHLYGGEPIRAMLYRKFHPA
jgi:(2Fe-2S) ferredoxin